MHLCKKHGGDERCDCNVQKVISPSIYIKKSKKTHDFVDGCIIQL